MKTQKLFAIIFCCALLVGVSSATASAQDSTLAGTTYRLSIYTYGLPGMNADASFLDNGVILIDNLMISGGDGNYYELPPAFAATYSVLSVTFGETTGDLSMYMIGTILSEGQSMFGLGFAFFEVEDTRTPYLFFFTGTLI